MSNINSQDQRNNGLLAWIGQRFDGFSNIGKAGVLITSAICGIALPVIGGVIAFFLCTALGKRRISVLEGEKTLWFVGDKGIQNAISFLKGPSKDLQKAEKVVADIVLQLSKDTLTPQQIQNRVHLLQRLSFVYPDPLAQCHQIKKQYSLG